MGVVTKTPRRSVRAIFSMGYGGQGRLPRLRRGPAVRRVRGRLSRNGREYEEKAEPLLEPQVSRFFPRIWELRLGRAKRWRARRRRDSFRGGRVRLRSIRA